MKTTKNNWITWLLGFAVITGLGSCKKFVQIDAPKTALVASAVFSSDLTADAAISGIYNQMISDGFASGNNLSFTYLGGLSADELQFYSSDPYFEAAKEFYTNSITASNPYILNNSWGEPYKFIYQANGILEGVTGNQALSVSMRQELNGEAKFIRAFCYFYLVNLFGDVPLVTSSDYRISSTLGRTPSDSIYRQIEADLTDAQTLLVSDYSFSNGERVRPNRWAAIALLARAALYHGDFQAAHDAATSVIDNTAQYQLNTDLDSVFFKNSSEAIWQLEPVYPDRDTWEAATFFLNSIPQFVALEPHLVRSFEPGDHRFAHWVSNFISGTDTFYFAYKYKVVTGSVNLPEYSMVLRLAEQYLIRAEASLKLGDLAGAVSDINIIRARAGLGNTQATTETGLLQAIAQERRVELFTEWGHRWLDLKRYGFADAVLGPLKGAGWNTTDQLYPIPLTQIQNDPAMSHEQNPGY